MNKLYSQALVDKLQQDTTQVEINHFSYTCKSIPDCDIEGAMDPRVYDGAVKSAQAMANMVKYDDKKNTNVLDNIVVTRQIFNGLKSIPLYDDTVVNTEQVSFESFDGIPLNVYHYFSDKTTNKSPILYYIHGGGFIAGHHKVVEQSLKMMVDYYGFHIFSVDYRLAPENPYPIGHKDCDCMCTKIFEYCKQRGYNVNCFFVAGDSAGGNLAQYCSTMDRNRKDNHICGQLLLYPTLNMAKVEDKYFHFSMDQYCIYEPHRPYVEPGIVMMAGSSSGLRDWLQADDINNEALNPYTRDVTNTPATFITVGEHDALKIESLAYAQKLSDASIDVEVLVYRGMGHAYFDNTGVYPQCEDCVLEMGQWINKHCK